MSLKVVMSEKALRTLFVKAKLKSVQRLIDIVEWPNHGRIIKNSTITSTVISTYKEGETKITK